MRSLTLPWLPPGRTVVVPGRGEVFVRRHQHADPTRPTLLLLHGWTASADLQFFTAYEALAAHWSFIAVDHRGHGRGIRDLVRYELEDAADDAAGVLRQLGVGPVITVGYSMGGPISLLLARRHPDLVAGLVVEATALEWLSTRFERIRWKAVPLLGAILRSWLYRRWLHHVIHRLLGPHHSLAHYVPWMSAEVHRGDTMALVQAGQALSRYDARPWAASLGLPAAAVITTKDRLVWPRKQEELAAALGAQRVELAGDHIVPWEDPGGFARATVTAVAAVEAALAARPAADQATSPSSTTS